MKKRMTAAAAIVMSVCLLAGCGSGESSSVTESRADVSSAAESAAESNAESVPKKLPETDEEWHRAMIEKSLVTLGDTGPVRRKIEKAKAGEKVTVAYLGGSITEGVGGGDELCYAKVSFDKF